MNGDYTKPFPVSVIGKEKIDLSDDKQKLAVTEAQTLGRLLAAEGFLVLTGGLGGIMEAVSKGVCEAGGISIGFVPILSEEEKQARRVSRFQTCQINTGMDQRVRIPLLINSCQAVIIISGGTGAWLEVMFAVANNVPVLSLFKTGGTAEKIVSEGQFQEEVTPCESVEMVLTLIKALRGN